MLCEILQYPLFAIHNYSKKLYILFKEYNTLNWTGTTQFTLKLHRM